MGGGSPIILGRSCENCVRKQIAESVYNGFPYQLGTDLSFWESLWGHFGARQLWTSGLHLGVISGRLGVNLDLPGSIWEPFWCLWNPPEAYGG